MRHVSTPHLDPLIQQIHGSGKRLVLSVTGGGSGAIATLLSVPGASASVLEAIVPYAPAALEQWLGGAEDQACSEAAARAMAMASFERARALADGEVHALVGVGATASLATTRSKLGPHRVHVAWQSAVMTAAVSCQLIKGRRSRADEEQIATQLVLDAVAEACGVESATGAAPTDEEPIERREKLAPNEWSELLLGERKMVEIQTDRNEPKQTDGVLLFPGAFHPFHAGHEQMADVAARRCGGPVTFELSIVNVDKRPLDFLEMDDRLSGLAGRRVWLTRAATFAEKAALAPGAQFVVGVDTIERIGNPRYYHDASGRRDAAIAAIAGHGCRFLVFGRQQGGRFRTLADLRLPPALGGLCEEVPESEFRADISSTELRSGST